MGEYRNGDKVNTRYATMRSILIINPNSTEAMTDGLKPLVEMLGFKDVIHHLFYHNNHICAAGEKN
jgi:hypothetical protein